MIDQNKYILPWRELLIPENQLGHVYCEWNRFSLAGKHVGVVELYMYSATTDKKTLFIGWCFDPKKQGLISVTGPVDVEHAKDLVDQKLIEFGFKLASEKFKNFV